MSDFLWVGEHPCLDFVNTEIMVDGRPTDLLESYDDWARWCAAAKIVEAEAARSLSARFNGTPQGEKALKRARVLRATLREMAEGLAQGREVSAETLSAINAVLRGRIGFEQVARLKTGFEVRFGTRNDETSEMLEEAVAASAAAFVRDADQTRVKKCGNPNCVLVFLDTTKSRTRRWCSMGLCGNRHKAAAHYGRVKERATQGR